MTLRKILRVVNILIAILLVAAAVSVWWFAWRPLARTSGAAAIAVSLLSLGGLLGRRPWAPGLEAARIAAACFVVF